MYTVRKTLCYCSAQQGMGAGGGFPPPPNETLQIEIDLPCLLFLVRQVRRSIKNKT